MERIKTCVVRKNGKLWARVRWTDANGKQRDRRQRVWTKAEGRDVVRQLAREVEDSLGRVSGNPTLAEVITRYEREHVKPPTYSGDTKVSGLRSHVSVRAYLRTGSAYLGKKKLRSLTYGDLSRFRESLLTDPLPNGKTRSVANAHRILAALRAALRFAVREGWLARSPFEAGAPLIRLSEEKQRERTLSDDEETRLLAACVGDRAHLRPILICALDTGMRQGEILTLQWRDVDLDAGIITIRAKNTKTRRARRIGITKRLGAELARMNETKTSESVFGLTCIKRSFGTACRIASVEGFRFHDLRHTAASRLVHENVPLTEVGRVLGHSEPKTTFRYSNLNDSTIRTARRALERRNDGREKRRKLLTILARQSSQKRDASSRNKTRAEAFN